MSPSTDRKDAYTRITETLIGQIEAGAGEWIMPWHRAIGQIARPKNILSGQRYRGVNRLMLWGVADHFGYSTPAWGTYRQWNEAGCQVRKGEKSAPIIVFKPRERPEEEGEENADQTVLVARAYHVFNADQVDGYTAEPEDTPIQSVFERNAAIEQFIVNTGARIKHGGNRAFYSRSTDHIQMPARESFVGTPTQPAVESYYNTVLHEAAHWTSAPHRCDRQLGKRFGDNAYAVEELIAEIAAAFLCADLGLAPIPRPDHAAYLSEWLSVLKADSRAIVSAASQAEKAADYLIGLQSLAQSQAFAA